MGFNNIRYKLKTLQWRGSFHRNSFILILLIASIPGLITGLCIYWFAVGKVENELRNSPYLLHDIFYEENVTFSVGIPIKNTDSFVQWITNITNGQLQMDKKEKIYIENDVK